MLLPYLVLIGFASVWYWHCTDDLQPYAVVQFYPLLLAPFLLIAFEPRYTMSHYYIYGLLMFRQKVMGLPMSKKCSICCTAC